MGGAGGGEGGERVAVVGQAVGGRAGGGVPEDGEAGVVEAGGGLQGEPGLADAAESDHGDQALGAGAQFLGEDGGLGLPADHRVQRDGGRAPFQELVAAGSALGAPSRRVFEGGAGAGAEAEAVGYQPDGVGAGPEGLPLLQVADGADADGGEIREFALGEPDAEAVSADEGADRGGGRRRALGGETCRHGVLPLVRWGRDRAPGLVGAGGGGSSPSSGTRFRGAPIDGASRH